MAMNLDLNGAAFWLAIAVLGATGSCKWSQNTPMRKARAALVASGKAEAPSYWTPQPRPLKTTEGRHDDK